jgi:hypothetical protein
MGHSKVVALLIAANLSLGCAGLRWSVTKAFREEGVVNLSFPEEVWKEYDCDNQKRPFFIIEDNELVPPKVEAGNDFNHRLVYVMCPANPTEVAAGVLATRIHFEGDVIVDARDESYEIKPGRWVVDAFVEIPENAEPGVYAYEIDFSGEGLAFSKSLTFLVTPP